MNRTRVNFLTDIVLLLLLVAVASTGLTTEFVLPRGSGGGSALLGMTRHGWADLHFWLSMSLMTVMALHLVLHWRWVWCVVAPVNAPSRGLRVALFVGLLLVSALSIAAPFLLPVSQGVGGGGGEGRGRQAHGWSDDRRGGTHEGGGRRGGKGGPEK